MAKSKEPAAPAAAKSAKNGKDGDNKPIRNLYLVDGSGYLFRAYPRCRP
jgi:DNA polymerase-1